MDECPELEMCSLLLSVEEGIQLWDMEGKLLYANPSTCRQFGHEAGCEGKHYSDMAAHCLDEDGDALNPEQFPVAQVLVTGAPCTDVPLQIPAADGQRRWFRVNAKPVNSHWVPGMPAVLSSTVDVTRLIERERALQLQAHYDVLTALPNRLLLVDRMKLALAHSQRTGDMLAVCMMDLDGFKPVNDALGHKAGDHLLQEVARRLLDVIRGEDTAARIGGDEFALLLGGLKSPGQCEQALKRILDAVAVPLAIEGHPVRVSASIGVTLVPGDVPDGDLLLRHADQAMYNAKEAGKNRFHMFDPTIESRVRANQGIVRRLETALEQGQLRLHYQPKVDCREGRVVGLEALVRWEHPVLGTRAPGEFLPLIEHEDVIIRLGEWVIVEALDELARLQEAGFDISISVNVSARQFLRGNFDARLTELLAQRPAEQVHRLEIEVVETAALEDINAVSSLINRYQALGVNFALDDFGTGYSSLVHLKRLAANALKIDQTFIRDMLDDPGDLAIVQGVIGLASAFQRQVVAEGVESIEQILMLLELGCDVMQGYGIARPMPVERVLPWLRDFQMDPRWRLAQSHYPQRADFDLLLMEVSHRHWFERLRAAIEQPEAMGDVPSLDYKSCRLAQWYAEVGYRRYGARPEFREIGTLHQQVHNLAEALQASLAKGDRQLARQTEQALAVANEALVSRLHLFRVAEASVG